MNTESKTKNKVLTVTKEDGTQEEIAVRTLRLGDYENARKLFDDELALTAFCCERTLPQGRVFGDKRWLAGDPPELKSAVCAEDYEKIRAAVVELNSATFFAYVSRREERDNRKNAEFLMAASDLSPNVLQQLTVLGQNQITAPAAPAGPRPRPLQK